MLTDKQKAEFIAAGLHRTPTEAEAAGWLNGPDRKSRTMAEQLAVLESALRGSPEEWRVKVLHQILHIPEGQLISYGDLARWANQENGLSIGPRNVAWLRKKIYIIIGHDTEIPLHRIAKDGDLQSVNDHPITQHFNRFKRSAEGSLNASAWLKK